MKKKHRVKLPCGCVYNEDTMEFDTLCEKHEQEERSTTQYPLDFLNPKEKR